MHLSVILPCFNEAQNIARAVHNVDAWFREEGINGAIIAVNDGSTDDTQHVLNILQSTMPCLTVIRHDRNRGYGSAVCSGCDAARSDVIAFMDSDGQFRAENIGCLLPFLREVDLVTGRRRKRADPFIRKMNGKLFGLLVYVILGVWVRDINCGMKLFTSELWQKVRPAHSTGALINAEVFSNMHRLGIPWRQVDVPHYPRLFGRQTGANLRVILRMFQEMWRLRRNLLHKTETTA